MYIEPFLRLVVSGPLYVAERWSWSLALVSGAGSGDVPTEVPAAVRTAIEAFHGGTHISSKALIDSIKLNKIGEDGRYVDQANTVQYDYAVPVPGGSTTAAIAPQVALAVTLRTNAARGLAHAGRFYVPTPSATPGTDGRISQASAETVMQAASTMISAINTALPTWNVGVTSNVGNGLQREVTHVQVGRVLDTIRSRRTSLPEEYVTGAPLTLT